MSVAFPVNMPPSAKMVLYTLVRKLCYSSISAIIDFVAVNYSHTRKFSLTAWGSFADGGCVWYTYCSYIFVTGFLHCQC